MIDTTTDAEAMSRRKLLRLASGAAVASMAGLLDLRQALAQARLTGRPLLNDSNLAAMLTSDRPSLAAFADDPLRFVESRFEMTPAMRAFVARLSADDLERARQAARLALATNRPMAVQSAAAWQDPAHHLAVVAAPPAIGTRAITALPAQTALQPSPVAIQYNVGTCADAARDADLANQLAAELQAAGITMNGDEVSQLAAAIGAGGTAAMQMALFITTTVAGGQTIDTAVQTASQGPNAALDLSSILRAKLAQRRVK
jgi:hypothetical protein